MDADRGPGEAVDVTELAGQVCRLDECLAGTGRVAGLVERATQRQQQVEPEAGIGAVGQRQGGERPTQVAGGILERQLAGRLSGRAAPSAGRLRSRRAASPADAAAT